MDSAGKMMYEEDTAHTGGEPGAGQGQIPGQKGQKEMVSFDLGTSQLKYPMYNRERILKI